MRCAGELQNITGTIEMRVVALCQVERVVDADVAILLDFGFILTYSALLLLLLGYLGSGGWLAKASVVIAALCEFAFVFAD